MKYSFLRDRVREGHKAGLKKISKEGIWRVIICVAPGKFVNVFIRNEEIIYSRTPIREIINRHLESQM